MVDAPNIGAAIRPLSSSLPSLRIKRFVASVRVHDLLEHPRLTGDSTKGRLTEHLGEPSQSSATQEALRKWLRQELLDADEESRTWRLRAIQADGGLAKRPWSEKQN